MAKKQTKPKAQPKYTEAFIAKALATWEQSKGKKSQPEIAKQLGVHPSMLYYWKAKSEGRPWGTEGRRVAANRAAREQSARQSNGAQGPGAGVRGPDKAPRQHSAAAENAALRREIATLREECEVLTKTVMVFARRRG